MRAPRSAGTAGDERPVAAGEVGLDRGVGEAGPPGELDDRGALGLADLDDERAAGRQPLAARSTTIARSPRGPVGPGTSALAGSQSATSRGSGSSAAT